MIHQDGAIANQKMDAFDFDQGEDPRDVLHHRNLKALTFQLPDQGGQEIGFPIDYDYSHASPQNPG
jgi:hypothetical protein